MRKIDQELLVGERALFMLKDACVTNSVFENGESPLKESRNIILEDDIFRWKYPIWYSRDIEAKRISLVDTARSGIWYTHNIRITDSIIQAPKTFRRSTGIYLKNVQLADASETMWSCDNITMENVNIVGDYFAKDSKNIKADNITITGNYAFDGAENIRITNSTLLSKDAFWNCKNVYIENCTIVGEYLAWNTENIVFSNCTIESNQGLCYIDNLVLDNCKLIHSDLIFEYATVKAEITTKVDSIKNPISGNISVKAIDEIIFDDLNIDKNKTVIKIDGVKYE